MDTTPQCPDELTESLGPDAAEQAWRELRSDDRTRYAQRVQMLRERPDLFENVPVARQPWAVHRHALTGSMPRDLHSAHFVPGVVFPVEPRPSSCAACAVHALTL